MEMSSIRNLGTYLGGISNPCENWWCNGGRAESRLINWDRVSASTVWAGGGVANGHIYYSALLSLLSH